MRTVNEIYTSLRENFYEAGGTAIREGGDMSLRLMAVAAQIYSLEAQCRYALRQAFPQTAEGEYLDRHAQVRALERRQAAKAAGNLRFYAAQAAAAELSIPAGTQCLDAQGRVFVTLEEGTIGADESFCSVAAQAQTAGSAGNAAAGSITFMRIPPTGIERVENPEAFSGGCDAEGDEELRQRVIHSYRRLPNGANAAWYEAVVADMEGVERVIVLPRERGRGTVDIVFSAKGGAPGEEMTELVQQMLDSQREICVDVLVKAPETVETDVSATINVKAGYDPERVCQAAERAISEYFSGDRLGEGVYRARLLSLIMNIDGVENCELELPKTDIAGEMTSLPVAGNISISTGE